MRIYFTGCPFNGIKKRAQHTGSRRNGLMNIMRLCKIVNTNETHVRISQIRTQLYVGTYMHTIGNALKYRRIMLQW